MQLIPVFLFLLLLIKPEWFTRRLSVGTKSLLFGAHQFILHPIAVARAWTELYGFPYDPRLWVAFFVHDLGYFGRRDMDGEDGKHHPELGSMIMGVLFGYEWAKFSLLHSRSYAKQTNQKPSKLCHADKLAFCYQWRWAYLTGTRLSGEISEYLENARRYNETQFIRFNLSSHATWYRGMEVYMRGAALEGAYKSPRR